MPRCVLVTGASGGIGSAIAAAFARAGDRVVLGYHKNELAVSRLAGELAACEVLPLAANVAEEQAVDAMFTQAEQVFGPVEVLVNCAGTAQQRLFQDITAVEWDAMMDTHAKGAFLCSRRALPAMLRKKQGVILNIASMWGQVGASCEVHYSAAKAAVIGMTKALAKEVGPSGIRVNCIAPGAVETAMLAGFTAGDKAALAAETPLGRLGTPEDIAAAAMFLASPGAAFITGQVLGVNGGFVI